MGFAMWRMSSGVVMLDPGIDADVVMELGGFEPPTSWVRFPKAELRARSERA